MRVLSNVEFDGKNFVRNEEMITQRRNFPVRINFIVITVLIEFFSFGLDFIAGERSRQRMWSVEVASIF